MNEICKSMMQLSFILKENWPARSSLWNAMSKKGEVYYQSIEGSTTGVLEVNRSQDPKDPLLSAVCLNLAWI